MEMLIPGPVFTRNPEYDHLTFISCHLSKSPTGYTFCMLIRSLLMYLRVIN